MSAPLPELLLPECMMPDGGECCVGYRQLEAALVTERAAREEAERKVIAAIADMNEARDVRDDVEIKLADALAAKERAETEKVLAEREAACWRTEFRERHAEKERAEAELLESRLHVEEMDELLSERWEEGRAARAEVARPTSALAGAREALEPFATFINLHTSRALPDDTPLTSGPSLLARRVTAGDFRRALDAYRALSLPTTEPTKAEEQT